MGLACEDYLHRTAHSLRTGARSKVKGISLTGPEGMQKQQRITGRTGHTDGKIHVYTGMHVGHVPDVVVGCLVQGGGRPLTLWHDS